MERIRRAVTAAGVLAAGLAAGCAGTQGAKSAATGERLKHAVAARVETVKEAMVGPATPPATNVSFMWQQRLGQLPDPNRGGALTPGLVGQAFVYADSVGGLNPADIRGDLTIQVEDITPGKPPAAKEVWHFTADVLRRMVVADERFGRSLAVFLPWPPEWRDVRMVSIRGKYDQPGDPKTVYAEPNTLTLDLSAVGPNQPAVVPGTVPVGGSAIPDVSGMVKQMQGGHPPHAGVPPAGWGVSQVGGVQPPPGFGPPPGFPPAGGMPQQQTMPPPGWQQQPQTWQPPPPQVLPGGLQQPQQETQRIVIPRGG